MRCLEENDFLVGFGIVDFDGGGGGGRRRGGGGGADGRGRALGVRRRRDFGRMVRPVVGTQHLDGGGAAAGPVVADDEIITLVGGRTEAARAQLGRSPHAGTVSPLVLHTLRQTQGEQLLDSVGRWGTHAGTHGRGAR